MAQLQSTVVTGSLHISGSDPKVGIRTTNPAVELHVQGDDIATRSTTTATSVLRLNRDVVDPSFPSTKDSAVDFMLSRQQSVNNNLPYTRLDIRLAGGTDSSTPSLDVMSFLHNGNVGIGTTSPSSKLHVTSADTNTVFTLGNTGTGGVDWAMYSANNGSAQAQSGGDLLFRNASSNILILQNDGDVLMPSGNVGIGTNGPGNKLHVSSTGGTVARFEHNDGGSAFIQLKDNSASVFLGMISDAFVVQTVGDSYATKFTITDSGNVGIGTTSPDGKLDIEINSNAVGRFKDDVGEVGSGNFALQVTNQANDALKPLGFRAEKFIFATGNVGIGVTDPSVELEVGGSTNTQILISTTNNTGNSQLYFGDSDSDSSGIILYRHASDSMAFEVNGGERMRINSSGNVGIGTQTPAQKLTVDGTISGSSDLSIDGDSVFDGTVGYNLFNSGFGGNGWRIDSSANAEFQNLTVRGTFSVYELLAQQIRATNGSLLVATSGKVDTSTGGATGTLTFDTGNVYGHGFLANDILLAQRLDTAGDSLKRTFLRVDTRVDSGSLTYTVLNGDNPEPGQEFVRIGNTTDADRQGHIYLTADDSNAPYIGVRDGVNAYTDFTSGTGSIEKVRVGKLSGVTTPRFGNLSGYGLWASGSVYLEGGINATFGKIGGWEITSTAITSSNVSINSDNQSIGLGSPTPGNLSTNGIFLSGSGEFNFQVVDDETGKEYIRQSGGVLDVRASKFFIGNESTQFISGADSNIEISSSQFHLDPDNNILIIGSDAVINASVTADSIRTPATIGGAPSTVANASSSIDSNGFAKFVSASIGGFDVSADAISGDNFYLSGSATGNEFFISSSNFNVKANGDLTASNANIEGRIVAETGELGDLDVTGTLTMTNTSDGTITNTAASYIISSSGIFLLSPSSSLSSETSRLSFKATQGSYPTFGKFDTVGELYYEGNDGELILHTKDAYGSTRNNPAIILSSSRDVVLESSRFVTIRPTTSATIESIVTLDSLLTFSGSIGSAPSPDVMTIFTPDAEGAEEGGGTIQDGVDIILEAGLGGYVENGSSSDGGPGGNLVLKAGAGGPINNGSGNPGASGSIQMFGNVGIGNTSPDHPLTVTANPGAADTPVAWIHNSGNVTSYDGTVISAVNDGSDVEVLHVRTNNTTYANGTSLMLVRGDGNVGIGNTNPQNTLHLGDESATSAGTLRIDGFVAGQFWKLEPGTNTLNVKDYGGTSLMSFDGANNYVLMNGGNVGIGTSSPVAKFEVSDGDSSITLQEYSNGAAIFLDGVNGDFAGGDYYHILADGSSYLGLGGYGGGATPLNINSSGNVGIGETSIDAKLHLTTATAGLVNQKFESAGSAAWRLGIPASQTYFAFDNANDALSGPKVVIDSSGNVGIGTSSPNYELTVRKDSAIPELAIEHFDTPSDNDTIGSILFRGNKLDDYDTASITTAATYAQIRTVITDISDNSADSKLEFRTQNNNTLTTGMSIEGTNVNIVNDLTVGGSISGTVSPSGNFSISSGNVVLDSGQGIDFSATSDASGTGVVMSSELLDDYEEGTWSPLWTGGGISSLTMNIINAHYTRVGNLVTVSAYFGTSAFAHVPSSGTNVYLHGLPFTPVANDYFAVNVGHASSWGDDSEDDVPSGGYIENAGSGARILFKFRSSADGATFDIKTDDFATNHSSPNPSVRNILMFSAIYYT